MGKKKEFDCEYNTTCDCSCDDQPKEDVIYAVTKILESDWNECILTNPKEFESKERAEKRKEIFEKHNQAGRLMSKACDILSECAKDEQKPNE